MASQVHIFYLLAITLTILIVDTRWAQAQKSCDQNDLQLCMEKLKVLTNNQDLAFARTEEELDTICTHLQEAMRCVNDFTDRCLDINQQEVYRTLTIGAHTLMRDLCSQGSDFRKKYLKHATCYKNLADDYKNCAENYIEGQNSGSVKVSEPAEDQLKHSCCLFDRYKHCTMTAVLSRCNKEAADLAEEIVTKAGGPLVATHCGQFAYDSEDCNGGQSRLTISSLLLALVVMTSLWRSRKDWLN